MVTTIEAKLENALANKLFEYGSNLPPVAWAGLQFPAAGDDMPEQFIEFRLLRNAAIRQTFDSNRCDGILRLTLKTRLPGPAVAASEVAGLIADHFNATPTFTSDGFTVILQQPAGVLGESYEDGWMMHPIEINVLAFS